MIRGRVRNWIGATALVAVVAAACGDDDNPFGPNPEDVEFAAALGVNLANMTRLPSGVYIQDVVVGMGDTAQTGDSVEVHYTGWLVDATEFDTTRDDNVPFVFPIVAGAVIPGWLDGVPGMIEGGMRKLVIPSERAYRSTGIVTQTGDVIIPGDAVLVFDVELLQVFADSVP